MFVVPKRQHRQLHHHQPSILWIAVTAFLALHFSYSSTSSSSSSYSSHAVSYAFATTSPSSSVPHHNHRNTAIRTTVPNTSSRQSLRHPVHQRKITSQTTTTSKTTPSATVITTNMASSNIAAAAAATPPTPQKRVRVTALDGIRALLACHIVLGHFLRYANPPEVLLRFFAQINITVGAFFALSGYVTAYTSTEVGERAASPKLTGTPAQTWWLQKIMGYYPMHWLVLLLFSPMFVFSDVTYGGWPAAVVNGVLAATLTQAWSPQHAEVWNAPTWFLSSMTFSTAIMPFALPKIAKMDKKALRRSMGWLVLINLLPVLGYCYDSNTWALVEGITPPKNHPALEVFNYQRFLPMFNVAEVLMGAVACRLAMLDTAESKDKPVAVATNWLSSTIPLIGLFAILALRATNLVPACSDLLVRGILFTPLFLKFVMGAHRNTVNGVNDPVLSRFLSSKTLVWLGGLSFPIYIVHGPLGQVFYKKLIANKLWGKVLFGPQFFALYLATVVMSAYLLNRFFLQSKAVATWSKNRVTQFSSWM